MSTQRTLYSVIVFDNCMMKMISLVIAMMMFNAAVTSPLFPAEGKHLLIETEDSESISRNPIVSPQKRRHRTQVHMF